MGVDLDTRQVSFVVVGADEKVAEQLSVSADGKYATDRFGTLSRMVHHTVGILGVAFDVHLVVIEALPFIKHRGRYGDLAVVLGAIRTACEVYSLPHIVVAGATWKSKLGLSPKATKADITKYTKKEHKQEFDTQDLTDAFCLALYGVRNG